MSEHHFWEESIFTFHAYATTMWRLGFLDDKGWVKVWNDYRTTYALEHINHHLDGIDE